MKGVERVMFFGKRQRDWQPKALVYREFGVWPVAHYENRNEKMKKRRELSFKNLPFVPVEGQVIYVEQVRNEKLNQFIRENYDWLKKEFRFWGFDFCFLPILAEEAIEYNAPYVGGEERKRRVEQLSSLSDYVVEGKLDVPYLVFALAIPVKDEQGNIVLQALPVKKHWYTSMASTFSRLARRAKKQYDEQLRKYKEKYPGEWNALCRRKFDLWVAQNKARGERIKEEKAERQRQRDLEKSDEFQGKERKESHIHCRISDDDIISLVMAQDDGIKFSLREGVSIPPSDPDQADSNFDEVSQKLVDEIKQRIAMLRNRGVNTMFLHDLIDEGEPLSKLLITKDFHIFLIDYDNLEIKMPALTKAVFLLFLRHPEGIRFKELADYYAELLEIYMKMEPAGSLIRQKQSVFDITNPCSNSINEKCARIRQAFVANFDDRLACHYYVTGKRGQAKRITIDPSMVIWEK